MYHLQEVRALEEEIEELRHQLEMHVQQTISKQLSMEFESNVQQNEGILLVVCFRTGNEILINRKYIHIWKHLLV